MAKVLISDLIELPSDCPFRDYDFTFVVETMKLIKKEVLIDESKAQDYAARCLAAAAHCSDLYSECVKYDGRMGTRKKRERGIAFNVRAPSGSTAKAREFYADSDDDYVEVADKATDAESVRKFVEQKYEILNKAHYLYKSVLERGMDRGLTQAGGYDSNAEYENVVDKKHELEYNNYEEKTNGKSSW